ncbi:XdhC family protein [Fictibacillus sp. B-59209]|uniref:XdhC family protein n=1 Tax=Fictibacillus sp. B-59209 TaxID=3024873 RepID=UPI002E217B64|nr:XdhC family protein [Fictibacillus sp. B-59209]
MNDFSRMLNSLKKDPSKTYALATIVRVDGSSYRREGAKMLIGKDESYYGTISAGCLEEDLIQKAKEVIALFEPRTVNYDLRSEDDLSWGQSAGCDGDIEVYIEPIGWELNLLERSTYLWPYIDQQLNHHLGLLSVKCISEGDNQGEITLYSLEGDVLAGTLGKEEILAPYIQTFLTQNEKVKLVHIEELQRDYLFEEYQPKENLFIFGAGPDAEPLVSLASQLDFSVVIIDPRSARCSETYFPQADHLIPEHPDSFFNDFQIPINSYVLVMTHNFNRDKKILQYLLQNPPKYLGVLGPKRRTERLVDTQTSLSCIHSPIGLSIGAEGPEEIAISVMAELIKIRNVSSFRKRSELVECQI